MLNELVKRKLTEEMFEQRLEESKRPNPKAPWRKRILDRRNSKCKDLESETFLRCLEKSKEAGKFGVK